MPYEFTIFNLTLHVFDNEAVDGERAKHIVSTFNAKQDLGLQLSTQCEVHSTLKLGLGKITFFSLSHLFKYANNVMFRLSKIQIMELNISLYCQFFLLITF